MTKQPAARRRTARIALLSAWGLSLAACAVQPTPLTPAQVRADATAAHRDVFADQEPIVGEVSFETALARALTYNLDRRVAMFEQTAQASQLALLSYDMLPRLTASAGYLARDRELIGSSRVAGTGAVSENQTISVDRQRSVADLTLSWNVLDFGTSYFQAHQQADRVLIARERRRRSVNNIFQDVATAYWQAATAQRLLPRVEQALEQGRRALATSQRLERDRAMPLADALRYQRTLLELIRQLDAVAEDMRVARTRLAHLMALPPGSNFRLAAPTPESYAVPRIGAEAEALERVALVNRPEVQEERYNIRIAQAETRRALLRYLPNLNPFALTAYDSNSYLRYNNWAEAGLRAGMNLLNLVSAPAAQELAQSQLELAQARRLAVSMAVVAQVHVSLQQFHRARQQYETASDISRVEGRLSALLARQGAADASSELERIRTLAASLAADLQRDRAYAEMLGAHAAVHVALGLDALPEDAAGGDVAATAAAIRRTQEAWTRGTIALPGDEPAEQASAGASIR